jgi:hypothetical protein
VNASISALVYAISILHADMTAWISHSSLPSEVNPTNIGSSASQFFMPFFFHSDLYTLISRLYTDKWGFPCQRPNEACAACCPLLQPRHTRAQQPAPSPFSGNAANKLRQALYNLRRDLVSWLDLGIKIA